VVSKYHPDSSIVFNIAVRADTATSYATDNSLDSFSLDKGAVLNASLQVTPASKWDKQRSYEMQVFHDALNTNYPAFDVNVNHLPSPAGSHITSSQLTKNGAVISNSDSTNYHIDTLEILDTLTLSVSIEILDFDVYNNAVKDSIGDTVAYCYNQTPFSNPPGKDRDTLLCKFRLDSVHTPNVAIEILIDSAGEYKTDPYNNPYIGYVSDTITVTLRARNTGTATIDSAAVRYYYRRDKLRLVGDTAKVDVAVFKADSAIWTTLPIAADSYRDSTMHFVAIGRGAFSDSAVIVLLPAQFQYEANTTDNTARDSFIIVIPVEQWGGKESGVMEMFSPNGDGINDYFRIRELDLDLNLNNRLYVFNRRGSLVYDSQGPYDQKWDAPGLPDGVYFYRLIIWSEGANPKNIMGSVEVRRR
jgi:gliding motility-associated-like protein